MTIPELLKNAELNPIGDYERNRLLQAFLQLLDNYTILNLKPNLVSAYSKNYSQKLANLKTSDIVDTLKNKFNFILLSKKIYPNTSSYFLYNNYSLLVIDDHRTNERYEIELRSFDCPEHHETVKLIKSFFTQDSTRGKIFLLEILHDDLCFNDIGTFGNSLTNENYSKDVLDSFDYVKNELPKKDPRGRLVILNGPAGSGKTHLIRGLAQDTDKCVFALLMAHQVVQLASPGTIPALLALRNTYKDKSIVFIIEDGDDLIVTRQEGNMGEIAQLLNLSDGILGNALDLKFVISTNADNIQVDDAIKRPGRLLRHLNVSYLSYEQSCEIYFRLTQKNPTEVLKENQKYLLTDLYALSRGSETKFEIKPKRLGFG
jgi:hypothetical protein